MSDSGNKNKGLLWFVLSSLGMKSLFSSGKGRLNNTLKKPANFEKYLGKNPHFYSGFYTYFRGKVVLKYGVKIRKKPEYWKGDLAKGMNTETLLLEVGQNMEVENPLVLPAEGEIMTQEVYALRLPPPVSKEGEQHQQQRISEYLNSWFCFCLEIEGEKEIFKNVTKDLPENLVFVRFGDNTGSIDYYPKEGGVGMMPKAESFVQANPFVVDENGNYDMGKVAGEGDLQTAWEGPVKTTTGELLQVGVVKQVE